MRNCLWPGVPSPNAKLCCRFYQHIPDSSDWAWRMCWGHASSADLVNWEHEPIALRPTPGKLADEWLLMPQTR